MCFANFGQLSNPCSRAITSWASARFVGLTAPELHPTWNIVQTEGGDAGRARAASAVAETRNLGRGLWPAFCIVRGWDGRVVLFQTYEAPFVACLGVRMSQAGKKIRSDCGNWRWALPFPRTGCALRARIHSKKNLRRSQSARQRGF